MAKQNEVTLDHALDLARNYHMGGNLTLADRTYRDVLKIYPNHFPSLHYLGILAYQRGAPEEGIVFLKEAIEIDNTNPETFNAYAVTLELMGQMDLALQQWEKALKLKPDFVDALSNYGNALWKNKQFEESQAACEKALKVQPDFHGALINLGNALMAQGKHEEAVQQWEKALEINPHHASAHINIGNSLRELGQITKSEEHCRKALALDPEEPNALLNLANALRDQGQYEEAEKLYRQATDIQPNHVRAHNNLAIVLMHMNRFEQSLVATRYALAFDPNSVEALGSQAVALKELNKLPEAESTARKALSLAPDSVEARVDLGEILFLLNNFQEAATLFDEAMKLEPDSSRLYIKLASALERAHRTEEAIDTIQKAVDLNPEMPEAYWVMGTTYFMANDIDNALKALDKAIEIKPDFIGAIATKAELLQSLGKMKESEELIMKAIEINDQVPNLYYTLANIKKFKHDDPELKTMKNIVENNDRIGQHHQTVLHYSLFKAYDRMKEYKTAFKYLKQGAAIKWETASHNASDQKQALNNIKKVFTKENIKKLKDIKGYDSDLPVFILGMPRSGTTLTEQIISSHPSVYAGGELLALTNTERELGIANGKTAAKWGEFYIDQVKNISDESQKAKRITDKMPGNYARIGQIIMALPNAKIIHCRRNPIDTCLSCYKQLFSRGHEWSYNFDAMAEHYEEYYNTMEHWRSVFSDKFIDIDYEETVNDFENQARRLIDYVDLEWNDACLEPHKSKRAVLTASKAQVVKPIYNTSIEGWKRYEDELRPLAEKLEKFVTK